MSLTSYSVASDNLCTAYFMLSASSSVPGQEEDVKLGRLVFNNACRTCDTTSKGDNWLGPYLYKIVGRKAGSLPNYGYSSAMQGADFVWDEAKLNRFIANPDEIVPGNNIKPYGASHQPTIESNFFLQSLTNGK